MLKKHFASLASESEADAPGNARRILRPVADIGISVLAVSGLSLVKAGLSGWSSHRALPPPCHQPHLYAQLKTGRMPHVELTFYFVYFIL